MTWRLDLPWLPRPPDDFRALVKTLGERTECWERDAVKLASRALNINQLHSLSRALFDARQHRSTSVAKLKHLKIGVISNATTKLLAPSIAATGLRYGFNIITIEGSFDQVLQDALDPASAVRQAKPEFVLVALDHRGLPGLSEMYVDDENAAVRDTINYIDSVRTELRKSAARLILQSVPVPPEPLFGNRESYITGSRRRRIEKFNDQLADMANSWGELWLDAAGLANQIGLDFWFDEPQWHLAKLAFAQNIVPLYADHIVRLVASARGRICKCLVLDLDNTCWGGVIGDDGLKGLVLGQGSAEGEAFLNVQRAALALRERGIILAVCSKNDENIARQPFQQHPEMLLREDHITIFLANWRDKATNIEAIAAALNIGLDSLVYLDDNPAERQQVRDELPSVQIPELPGDPALYPRTLLAAGYFEAASITLEDSGRAQQYQANARRELESARFRNLDDYLKSLAMVITFAPFDAIGRSRISQLIARSNQFNLTTRRYSEADIEALESDADVFTVQVRLADKFGDNGMISVIICRQIGADWQIDTWLMSCRVLKRQVEHAVLNHLITHAQRRAIRNIVGIYRPTDRNALVKDHYEKLGFQPLSRTPELEQWQLKIDGYQPFAIQMAVNDHSDSS